MGAVYEANHLLIKRRLAVKLLHEEHAKQEWTVQRFKQEARAATAIGHDHIVDITDMGMTDKGEIFIVMEYLDGMDLSMLLQYEEHLSPKRASHIMIQVMSALEAAHAKGIIHRDLKPANIFLISHGGIEDYVKLVDFGISKVKQGEKGAQNLMTRTGELLGTPSFMSPEQAVGEVNISPQADIFSAGVILYNLLTGELPFQDKALTLVLMKIINETPRDICQCRPEIPQAMADIVNRALQKKPEDRFPDAAAFRRALLPFSPETPNLAGLKSTRYGARASVAQLGSRPSIAQSKRVETTPLDLVESQVRRRSSGVFKAVVLLMSVAAVAGVVLCMLWGPSGYESGDQPEAPAAVAPVVPVAKEPAEPAEPTEETAPASIALKIRVTPAEARVSLDGRVIGTGSVEKTVPKDAGSHEITIEAAGYTAYRRSITFAENVNLAVVLGRESSATSGSAGTQNVPHKPTAQEPPSKPKPGGDGSTGAHPAAPKPDAPAADTPKPKGESPYGAGPIPIRPIDEDAPW
jgi:tRNA A-37 threonylcarbamoyl transferase component Bud32